MIRNQMAVLSLMLIYTITPIMAIDQLPTKDIVSVLYFENITKNAEFSWLSKGIADMLTNDIAGNNIVDVVEREELRKVINEQQLSMTGLMDIDRAIEMGKLLSATKLIYGSFIIKGKTIVCNGRITDTKTGKIISAFSARGTLDDVLLVQSELSKKAREALGIDVAKQNLQAAEYKVNAVKAYYQGVDLLDNGAVEAARKKFEEASKIDPNYLKPYQGIEESYKYLKDFIKMRHQREIAQLYDKIFKIRKRLKEKPWRTFADIAMDPYYVKMSREDKPRYDRELFAYFQGDTPAVCTWNLQNNIFELADKYEEYFNDKERSVALNREVISITDQARKNYIRDPFFPEILYSGLRASVYLNDWHAVKNKCEELMENYPDYRMMWAIEDFYKRALEKLSPQ